MLLLFRHPPCFLAGRRGVAVGTEAIGPEWVYGVVTFLGLDEKKRAVLCRNKAAGGGGGVFWALPFLSSAVRLFISAESILHHSKQLFLYEHLPLSVFLHVNWTGSWGTHCLLLNSGCSIPPIPS